MIRLAAPSRRWKRLEPDASGSANAGDATFVAGDSQSSDGLIEIFSFYKHLYILFNI